MSPSRATWCFLSFAALACGRPAAPPAPSANTANDSTGLATTASAFLAAFDSLNWPQFTAYLSDTVDAYWPRPDTADRLRDRTQVEARYREFFDRVRSTRSGPPYLHLAVRDLSVRVLGDIGLVTFELADVPDTVGRRTIVFQRQNGEWRVIHLHASNLPVGR